MGNSNISRVVPEQERCAEKSAQRTEEEIIAIDVVGKRRVSFDETKTTVFETEPIDWDEDLSELEAESKKLSDQEHIDSFGYYSSPEYKLYQLLVERNTYLNEYIGREHEMKKTFNLPKSPEEIIATCSYHAYVAIKKKEKEEAKARYEKLEKLMNRKDKTDKIESDCKIDPADAKESHKTSESADVGVSDSSSQCNASLDHNKMSDEMIETLAIIDISKDENQDNNNAESAKDENKNLKMDSVPCLDNDSLTNAVDSVNDQRVEDSNNATCKYFPADENSTVDAKVLNQDIDECKPDTTLESNEVTEKCIDKMDSNSDSYLDAMDSNLNEYCCDDTSLVNDTDKNMDGSTLCFNTNIEDLIEKEFEEWLINENSNDKSDKSISSLPSEEADKDNSKKTKESRSSKGKSSGKNKNKSKSQCKTAKSKNMNKKAGASDKLKKNYTNKNLEDNSDLGSDDENIGFQDTLSMDDILETSDKIDKLESSETITSSSSAPTVKPSNKENSNNSSYDDLSLNKQLHIVQSESDLNSERNKECNEDDLEDISVNYDNNISVNTKLLDNIEAKGYTESFDTPDNQNSYEEKISNQNSSESNSLVAVLIDGSKNKATIESDTSKEILQSYKIEQISSDFTNEQIEIQTSEPENSTLSAQASCSNVTVEKVLPIENTHNVSINYKRNEDNETPDTLAISLESNTPLLETDIFIKSASTYENETIQESKSLENKSCIDKSENSEDSVIEKQDEIDKLDDLDSIALNAVSVTDVYLDSIVEDKVGKILEYQSETKEQVITKTYPTIEVKELEISNNEINDKSDLIMSEHKQLGVAQLIEMFESLNNQPDVFYIKERSKNSNEFKEPLKDEKSCNNQLRNPVQLQVNHKIFYYLDKLANTVDDIREIIDVEGTNEIDSNRLELEICPENMSFQDKVKFFEQLEASKAINLDNHSKRNCNKINSV